VSEEKHERPFENVSVEDDPEETKRPKKRRRPPFEDEIEHQLTGITEKFPVGNVFDAEVFEPEPAKMIVKRLKDEGFDFGD
jgi:hypothetical protein